jgi:hypothetical protein
MQREIRIQKVNVILGSFLEENFGVYLEDEKEKPHIKRPLEHIQGVETIYLGTWVENFRVFCVIYGRTPEVVIQIVNVGKSQPTEIYSGSLEDLNMKYLRIRWETIVAQYQFELIAKYTYRSDSLEKLMLKEI